VSRVLLGWALRCVGVGVGVLTVLCCAEPALGSFPAGAASIESAVSGSSPLGSSLAARLRALNAPSTLTATASRACAYENMSVRRASPSELRSAVVCLINRVRGWGGLPGLREQSQLDAAAQNHDNQMVGKRFFGHGGIPPSSPALRISATGFSWGAYGEAISTGFRTPQRAVAAWLRSLVHCQILLSPQYRYVGIGVSGSPVAGWARMPGTWTADLALPRGWASPSRNWGLAAHCPY
jgi:uncharacterized protein YkwD